MEGDLIVAGGSGQQKVETTKSKEKAGKWKSKEWGDGSGLKTLEKRARILTADFADFADARG